MSTPTPHPAPPVPPFGAIDGSTAELLKAVTTSWRTGSDRELFTAALRRTAALHGRISHNDVRRLVSNEHGLIIAPRRYSALWHWAADAGLIRWDGEYDQNDDARSHNRGKPQRVYQLCPEDAGA